MSFPEPETPAIGRHFKRRVVFSVFVTTATVAAIVALWESRIVLLVLFAGCLGALILATLTSWLEMWLRIRRAFAFTLVLLGISVAMGLGVWLRGPALVQQFSELQRDIPDAANSVLSYLRQFGGGRWLLEQATDTTQLSRLLSYAASGLGGAMIGTVSTIACLLLVLLSSLYLAAEPHFYLRGIRRIVPQGALSQVEACLAGAIRALRFWLISRLVSMTAIGLLVSTGLMLLAVPLAGTLGLIAALLTFVPNLGPFLSALPAVLLALAISPTKGLLTVLLFCVAHFIEGNLVTPLADRRIVKLPPFLTLSLQLLLAPATGALGVALAAPLLAATLGILRVLVPPANSQTNQEVSPTISTTVS